MSNTAWEREEEIPVPISAGSQWERSGSQSASSTSLIILPIASIPSSCSHSQLNLCWNMAAGTILAKRWSHGCGGGWREGLGRRQQSSWPWVSVVDRLSISCQAILHLSFPSLHLTPFFPALSFWHSSDTVQLKRIKILNPDTQSECINNLLFWGRGSQIFLLMGLHYRSSCLSKRQT